MSALEEYLIGEPETDDDAEPVEAPETLEQADWQLRKIARLRRLMAENDAVADAEVQRIRSWQAEENAKLQRAADFYETALRMFHEALLEQDPKRLTINLPAGTMKARKSPDKVDVLDPVSFVHWANEARPELVRIKAEPNKSEIKRLLAVGPDAGDYGFMLLDAHTGQAAPGIVLVPGERSFVVTVGEACS